jgi:hypothetical protein
MPLKRGKSNATREANARTLIAEVGKSPHVKSKAQAIAISYAVQRRSGKKK